MKKKILALCLVLVLALTAIGGTLAYFTDTEEATNTFTVGSVDIQLLESKYHRQGNGNAGISKDDMVGNEYTDDQIKADAANYEEYLKEAGDLMVPGRKVAKSPYVLNTGKNDAFVRVRVMIPAVANGDFVDLHDGGIITNQWCATAIKDGDIAGTSWYNNKVGGFWHNCPIKGENVTIDGLEYNVYVFTYTEALEPEEMTYWSAWNYIGIDPEADNEDIQKAIDAGVFDDEGNLKIFVEADAIQAEGFETTTEGGYTTYAYQKAWAAFDGQEVGEYVESESVKDDSDTVFGE